MAQPLPKDEVRRLLDALPDEASYEDIQYHIYVQQKIDHGIEASDRGDFISDEEIERRKMPWWGHAVLIGVPLLALYWVLHRR